MLAALTDAHDIFKAKRINGRFALILCLFADSMFVLQLHTDEIATLGLLTIIHVNQLLHGNVSERAAQRVTAFLHRAAFKHLFYRFMLELFLHGESLSGDTCSFFFNQPS